MSSVRAKLNRAAHGLAASLDIDHETLSDFVCVSVGVESMSDLKVEDLRQLVNRLGKEVSAMNSVRPAQEGEIYRLGYKVLKWDSASIKGFINRQTGRRCSVQSLSPQEASKLIQGLLMVAAS